MNKKMLTATEYNDFYDILSAIEYKGEFVIETQEDYLICIPFRSSIRHKEAFFFTNTNRSKRTRSGLDYKKTIIIKEPVITIGSYFF